VLGNLQYTTFYKFLVSLGVVLVALGVVIPWLLLHESFDLFIERSSLERLTPLAQETIRHRQMIVHASSIIAPWVSIILVLSGLSLIIFGVERWRRRQAVMDRTEDVSLLKLEAETIQIQRATPPEQDAKQGDEAWEVVQAKQPSAALPNAAQQIRALGTSYRITKETIVGLESEILAKLEAAFSPTHEITSQAKLILNSRRVLLDAIIAPRETSGDSYLIEVKYVTSSKSILNSMLDAVGRLSMARRAYAPQATGPVRCVILFVVADKDERLMDVLQDQLGALPDEMEAIAFYEMEVPNLTSDELRRRILGVLRPPSGPGAQYHD
jgi:hypothetical protein